jgi:hypothetical protein
VFRRRNRQGPDPAGHEPPAGPAAGEDAAGEEWGGDEGWDDSDFGPPIGGRAGAVSQAGAASRGHTTGDHAGLPGAAGPYDAHDDVPAGDRMDFGSLLVPAREGFEVQLTMAEDQPAWIMVVRGSSGLQLQAFAAPKSGGLWDEVREEIAAEIAKAGGSSSEATGPFGVELRARIPGEPGSGLRGLQPARFLGVDGPRWFLRGVISGPAAEKEALARPLEEVFAGVVVVRGDHPAPPRDLLEIRLPPQAADALAAQAHDVPGSRWEVGPPERGPEITETR